MSFPWRKNIEPILIHGIPSCLTAKIFGKIQVLRLSPEALKAIDDILSGPVQEPSPALIEAVRAYRDFGRGN